MQNYTPEDIEKAINALPQDVSDAITDPAVGEKMQAIGKKYNLHIDQLDALMGATNFVMIGLIPPEKFKAEKQERTGLTEIIATQIVNDISEQIIKGIREKMQVHEDIGEKFTEEELERLLDDAEEEAQVPDQFAQSGIEILEPQTSGAPAPAEAAPLATQTSSTATFAPHITAEEVERGITGEKLAGPFKMPKEARDYSITRSMPEAPVDETIIRHRDRVDPYHEPIE